VLKRLIKSDTKLKGRNGTKNKKNILVDVDERGNSPKTQVVDDRLEIDLLTSSTGHSFY
jgi:hypothetical protein